jgi:hypothetical protein
METVDYSKKMLETYSSGGEHRVIPFISPLAPFLDPGSRAFEEPEKHGFKLFARTLEEHRQRLLEPSWKYVLNYETKWMNRDKIVDATYEAGRRMNQIKADNGVISAAKAEATEIRIDRAVALMKEIDTVMLISDEGDRKQKLNELKHHVDNSNESTVVDKRELEAPIKGMKINFLNAAGVVLQEWWKDATRSSPEK